MKSSAKHTAQPGLEVQKTYKLYIDGKFPRTESGRYHRLEGKGGKFIANVCLSSRKDLRDAIVAARKAQAPWNAKNALLRGQILYRIAEMLEGRKEQFVTELMLCGNSKKDAENEVRAAIDRIVYYAGWADKYQQVFSAVNSVASSHFNFSLLEPTGLVSVICPESSGLLGFVSAVIPVIAGGNAVVCLASFQNPLSAISFAEVMHAGDLPGGVVNILTGTRKELLGQFSSHMDVNAVIAWDCNSEESKLIRENASLNVKRAVLRDSEDLHSAQSPYTILDAQEVKTTWHPVGI